MKREGVKNLHGFRVGETPPGKGDPTDGPLSQEIMFHDHVTSEVLGGCTPFNTHLRGEGVGEELTHDGGHPGLHRLTIKCLFGSLI